MRTIVNIYSNSIGSITHYCVREWTINIYAAERFVLDSKLSDDQKKILSESGVYILVNENCVYVGQAQIILDRWKQHLGKEDKDWFTCAYAITDERGFSATDLNALEYLFHLKAQEATRFAIMNSQSTDNQKKDYYKDPDFYNSVFANVNLLLNSIYRGHRVFDKLDSENELQTDASSTNGDTSLNDEFQNKIFTMNCSGCFGKLKKVKEGWLLLKGAKARDYQSGVQNEYTQKTFSSYIAYLSGKLDDNLETTEDILFPNPSAPIVALTKTSYNGWGVWKDEKGILLKKYRDLDG